MTTQDLSYDPRALRNGPPKLIDIRKVEGKKVYIDLIERKAMSEIEMRGALNLDPGAERVDLMFKAAKGLQITQLAAQHILWGEQKWQSS